MNDVSIRLLPLSKTRQGLRPTRWGPILWYFLFVTTFYWHRKQTSRYSKRLIAFVQLFLVLLYCIFCRESFQEFHNIHDPNKKEYRSNLVKWLHFLHNWVNRKLNKPLFPFSLVEPVFIEENHEELYWKEDLVSPHYYYCMWCILYLSALNFPPQIDPKREFDLKTQTAVTSLFHDIILLLPSAQLQEEMQRAFPSQQQPKQIFTTRKECFDFVFEWEQNSIHKENSLFGKNKEEVIDYFETHFRTPKS